MIDDLATQVVFTAVFVALGLYSLVRLVADRARPVLVVSHGLHVVMAAVMAYMLWPAWAGLSAPAQLALFAAATLWFLVLALVPLLRRPAMPEGRGHSPAHDLGHAVMMLAMVWMVAVMQPDPASADTATGHAHAHAGIDGWAAGAGILVTAALLVCGVLLLVELLSRTAAAREDAGSTHAHGRFRTGDPTAGSVMSLAMAAMCWPMLAL